MATISTINLSKCIMCSINFSGFALHLQIVNLTPYLTRFCKLYRSKISSIRTVHSGEIDVSFLIIVRYCEWIVAGTIAKISGPWPFKLPQPSHLLTLCRPFRRSLILKFFAQASSIHQLRFTPKCLCLLSIGLQAQAFFCEVWLAMKYFSSFSTFVILQNLYVEFYVGQKSSYIDKLVTSVAMWRNRYPVHLRSMVASSTFGRTTWRALLRFGNGTCNYKYNSILFLLGSLWLSIVKMAILGQVYLMIIQKFTKVGYMPRITIGEANALQDCSQEVVASCVIVL